MKVAGCRAALNPLRIYYVRQCILPIATWLLWPHAVDELSTLNRELQQIK